MTVQIGILLALFCAFFTNLGFLFKHRGACAAPTVEWKHPLRSAKNLWTSKWFAIGMGVAIGAWFFHVAAMALAPLSLVQAVISAGLVFLAVLADRVFGFNVGPRQWVGVCMTALGLALLAITLPAADGAHTSYSHAAMISFEAGLLAVGGFIVWSPSVREHEHHGVFLGAAAGIMFGVSDIAIKALTGASGFASVVASPWLAVTIVASVVAFYASASGLQKAEAVPVIALTSAAANVSAIAGGIVVFGDPMPSDTLGIILQSLAFLMVIVASALTPGPMRAAESSAS
jgi:drug/metabolite transporter (DMT)-like permease